MIRPGRFFGPILPWEMTTIVRRSRHYVLRGAYVAVLLFMLFQTYHLTFWGAGRWESTVTQFPRFANRFFWTFSFLQLTVVLLLAPAYVATAIAIEKERRTIEYLFATDLSNREIVLGKWVARSLNVLMLILAGVPVLSAARLFGGVDIGQLVVSTLICASCLASTAAVAMLVSVYAKSVRVALGNAYALLLLLLISPYAYYGIVQTVITSLETYVYGRGTLFAWQSRLLEPFTIMHGAQPYGVFLEMSRGGQAVRLDSSEVLWMIGIHGGITLVCLLWSVLLVRRTYIRAVEVPAMKKRRQWGLRLPRLIPAVRLLGTHAMLWKDFWFERRRVGCVIMLGITLMGFAFYLPILGLLWDYYAGIRYDARFLEMYLPTVGTMIAAVLYVGIAVRSATSITTERVRDCWDSLLATPITGREIIEAKLASSLKPLVGLIVFLFPAWMVAVSFGELSLLAIPSLVTAICGYGFFVAALGVYHSLQRKTTGGAFMATFGVLLAVGGGGHLIGGLLLFLPLVWLGTDSEVFMIIYTTSLPWVVLVGSAFGPDAFSFDTEWQGLAVLMAVFFWGLFVVAGGWMVVTAVTQFNGIVGRTDDDVRRPPTASPHGASIPKHTGDGTPTPELPGGSG